MTDEFCAMLNCPAGTLLLKSRRGRLTGIELHAPDEAVNCMAQAPADCDSPGRMVLDRAKRQLEEYFSGHRTTFDLPLDLTGLPPFTRKVLETLRSVPCGVTLTYGELACRAGNPRAARAVGRAMAANPLPIVIPCHRVTAAGGKLGGYSGGSGPRTKERLLALERTGHFAN